MVKIIKIYEYSYSYAEYQVSDGNREIRCICNSVPLPDDLEPQVGMPVKLLYAFCYNNLFIKKVSSTSCHKIKKRAEYFFGYEIIGTVLNKKASLIKAFDFIISLEYFYPDGITDFEEGDVVLIVADRMECELDV